MEEHQREQATDRFLGMRRRGEASDPVLDPLVYDELRRLAGRLMRRERRAHTLQPTALVHEAYARLIDSSRVQPNDRTHFLALATSAMRRILVDHARRREAAKRGGGWGRVTLSAVAADGASRAHDLVALDDALRALAELDARKARIVELRMFAGLEHAETAEVPGISERVVRQDWQVARAWLAASLDPE